MYGVIYRKYPLNLNKMAYVFLVYRTNCKKFWSEISSGNNIESSYKDRINPLADTECL